MGTSYKRLFRFSCKKTQGKSPRQGGHAYGGYFLRTPEEPNISFFFLRKPFRREVVTVYITLSEFLLIGTFVLNLIRLLRDIYNKKK